MASLTPEQKLERTRAYRRKHYAKHRDKIKEKAALYRESHREEARLYALRYHRARTKERRVRMLRERYGITPEDYDLLFAAQEGVCALCQQPPKLRKVLYVDHDHATGKVRGLLCEGCNYALGRLGDSPEGVMRAYRYLVNRG